MDYMSGLKKLINKAERVTRLKVIFLKSKEEKN
jgi:hypothetical protein